MGEFFFPIQQDIVIKSFFNKNRSLLLRQRRDNTRRGAKTKPRKSKQDKDKNKTRQSRTSQQVKARKQDKARPADTRLGEAEQQVSWATLSCLEKHFGFFFTEGGYCRKTNAEQHHQQHCRQDIH